MTAKDYTDDQIRTWRAEYGLYTLVPPPDWQPSGVDNLRMLVAYCLRRVGNGLSGPLTRFAAWLETPARPRGIAAGTYRGARDLS